MKFNVGVGRNESAHAIAGVARAAEQAGFDYITVVDQPHLSRDVHVMMTLMAQATENIHIGHGVTQAGTWHPVMIANGTATINEISDGRAFIGFGSGGNALLTMDAHPTTLQAVRDAIEFFRAFMGGEDAVWRDHKMHSEWVRDPVPIIMGCTGPKSTMLGGELADGVISIGCDPLIVDWRQALIKEGAERAGRDPATCDLWVRGIMYVADTKEEARREVASYTATEARDLWFSIFRKPNEHGKRLAVAIEDKYPGLLEEIRTVWANFDHYQHEATDAAHNQYVTQRMIDFFNLTGSVDDIAPRIEQMRSQGIRTISTVQYTMIDKTEQILRIGETIIPKFKHS